jgi:hypothetical protein
MEGAILMAAKKKKRADGGVAAALAEIAATNAAGLGLLDEALEASVIAAQEKQACDGQIFSADDVLARLICLPMPALAPRFLLHSEGWPLGRFFLIDGFKETCKSAFLSEVGTWHRALGGSYVVIETEQKDGSGLRDSFFNHDRRAWKLTRAFSQDGWNRAFFHWTDQFHRIMDGFEEMQEQPDGTRKKVKGKGMGRVAPVCLGVDSISAVLIEKFVDEMRKEGAPEMNHPQGARLLSDFFKVGPKELTDYPMTFMAVSHLREHNHPQNQNIKIRSTTGGEAPKFQTTTEIEMKRRKAGQYTRVHKQFGEIYAIDLTMLVRKNSLGNHEHIDVEMCWYFDADDRDPINGEPRQKSYFDWHSSSIELLKDCMKTGDEGQGFTSRRAKTLRELLDLTLDEDRRQAWSDTLGVAQEDKLSYRELGLLLEQRLRTDAEFCKNLYEVMGIRRQFMFQRGVDFRAQIAANRQRLIGVEQSAGAAPELPEIDDPLSLPEVP